MRYLIVFHVLLVSLLAAWPVWATVGISGRVLGPAGVFVIFSPRAFPVQRFAPSAR